MADKLYKRTTTGKIQEWAMERLGCQYRTHSGQVGGKIVTSEWTTCQGKNLGRANETSPQEQATREVESQYTLQRKKGYRDTPEEAQESDRFQPMLAKNFEDYADKLAYPVFAQPKLDGIRMIARADGLWSRTGNRITGVPHIEDALKPAFVQDPDLVLDGEAYSHDLREDFNSIVSAVKKQDPSPEELDKSRQFIQYWVYDSPGEGKFDDRLHRIEVALAVAGFPACLVSVSTRKVSSREALDKLYELFLEGGYEGQMVRVDASYEQKRTKNLLKRKEFADAEFQLVEIIEGDGNRAGMAGAARLLLDDGSGRTFKADIMGDREFKRKLLAEAAEYIGKEVTVKFFAQRTPAGIPRFGKTVTFHRTARF